MAKDIVMHDWNSFSLPQTETETKLGKHTIPIGYVNATLLCQINGKEFRQWKRLDRTMDYLKALSLDARIPTSRLCIKVSGTPNGDPRLQGTWVHPDVAIDIARWISPQFQVWANRVLLQVITGKFRAQTAGAAIAQYQLANQYDRILNQPEPWERLSPEFCTQVYAWYGPQFYWTFCYCFLSPVERCKIDQLNPPTNGNRKHRIHQFLPPEIKERLTPYLNELLAIICMAKGDKQAFIVGYGKHFGNADQLEMF